jgi:hypothetical protein
LWPPGALALACAAARAIRCAVTRSPYVLCAFVALAREQGTIGRAGMLPITIGARGVTRVVTPSLSTRDRVRLQTALSS